MLAGPNLHLSYCTNIHHGETWQEVFKSLQEHILPIKAKVSPDKDFGIGLRLSDFAAKELLKDNKLEEFHGWLKNHNLYVFTMNGFPFGRFHRERVKDDVHKPDWVTSERTNYTKNLVKILSYLLPEGMQGGISTSPLSYKPWYIDDPEQLEMVFHQSTKNLLSIVEFLINIKQETGKTIHIDIEPEPDGLLENSKEFINYYKTRLIPAATKYLLKVFEYDQQKAETAIGEHVQLCYDVCHFAVAYENPVDAIEAFNNAGIKIGKIQISAALKAKISDNTTEKQELKDKFKLFNESTYLHQVVEQQSDGKLVQYPDLPLALKNFDSPGSKEWRMHFHVPIFMQQYGQLESTQDDIAETLKIAIQQPVTQHLEIETYTWEVLPQAERLNLTDSIIREIEWVREKIKL